ncbi:SDR family oxidoreductase [Lichenicoccus roseus]|uniref:SDR family oxidoreductase n=1 Tax=Lichenicoccus roseus TaxID=2683649 RepID=A0A5R9JAF6_9PROT|nr:SDR family oxidoreductase [Lichenicoccus roseus]TLU74552.1 SDR family oxidoreductase [Lichenicoccus roseus]
MRLDGKIALITGGNSGIGFATAALFIREGAKVAITGRNPETLEAARRELGADAIAIRADLTIAGEIEGAVAAAIERFGGLDIVFANAGISGPTPIGETTFAAFDSIVRTNLHSAFFTIQAALPHLHAGASVILNGSVHQVLGIPGAAAYAASKGAIGAMSRVLASELAPRGIRVNVVVPGATRTPIWTNRAPTPDALEALEARYSRAIPLGRFGEADHVARAVLYLASDDAGHTTATELVVDGGTIGAPGGAPVYR